MSAATAVVLIGVALFIVFHPSRLASETLSIGASRVRFEMRQQDGGIYVSAQELRMWGGGFRIKQRLGAVEEVGNVAPLIRRNETTGLVDLRVGVRIVEFDPVSQAFLLQP